MIDMATNTVNTSNTASVSASATGLTAMIAMIIRELRANIKPLLVWSLTIILFNIAGMMKFEGIAAGNTEAVRQLTEAFPKVALAVMGISGLDMSTFAGYYAVLEFYVGIMAAVYAVALARNAVLREMVDGTYEFLFVRPVSRSTILTAKFVAALIDAIVFAAVNLVSSLACLPMLGDGSAGAEHGLDDGAAVIWRFSLWLFVMMLVFGAIGACVSLASSVPSRGAAVGNGSVIVAYGAGVVYDMFADHDASVVARILSPFRYVTPDEVINGHVPVPFAILAALIVIAGFTTTYLVFNRRDLVSR
ncbi:hypothetical protein EP30_11060 [Bifidobacterium sp. UTCIF-39]|nr:hypothetical protein EP30_11060 [Bifidobacterium sp. UTCIF-39]